MRKILILCISIFMLSCNQNKKEIQNDGVVEVSKSVQFDWLIGDWVRLNEKQGKQTFEHWKKTTIINIQVLLIHYKEKIRFGKKKWN